MSFIPLDDDNRGTQTAQLEQNPFDAPYDTNADEWSSMKIPAVHIKPRVILADDHLLMAEGLARLISDDYQVVAVVSDGQQLVRAARKENPDLAVVDISMPELTGMEAARTILSEIPTCKILFLSMHARPEFVREAFRIGALGYVLKRAAASELMEAMREVMSGKAYLSPHIAKDALSVLLRTGRAELTDRQREVLRLVAEGRSAKEIASLLNISVKTAQFHKTNIMEKLDVHTTAELTRYALAHGIAS